MQRPIGIANLRALVMRGPGDEALRRRRSLDRINAQHGLFSQFTTATVSVLSWAVMPLWYLSICLSRVASTRDHRHLVVGLAGTSGKHRLHPALGALGGVVHTSTLSRISGSGLVDDFSVHQRSNSPVTCRCQARSWVVKDTQGPDADSDEAQDPARNADHTHDLPRRHLGARRKPGRAYSLGIADTAVDGPPCFRASAQAGHRPAAVNGP